MHPFAELIASGTPVILDGAGGTELERRGIPDDLRIWSASGLKDAPETIVEIHREMIEAGSQIITTQTFSTGVRRLERAGIGEMSGRLTRDAVALAIRARDEAGRPGVLVAGSYSPAEQCYHPELAPAEEAAFAEHLPVVQALAEAGSDFLLAETFNTIEEAKGALRAGVTTGLDVVVGFVCGRDGRLLSGETVTQAVRELTPLGPAGYAINCTPVAPTTLALAELARATNLPFGAYSNVGDWSSGTWGRVFGREVVFDVSPDAYMQHATTWIEFGASFVGGCCGTQPEHIRALSGRFRAVAA